MIFFCTVEAAMFIAFEMVYARLEVEAILATLANEPVPNCPLHLKF